MHFTNMSTLTSCLGFNKPTTSFVTTIITTKRSCIICYDQKVLKCKLGNKNVVFAKGPEPEGTSEGFELHPKEKKEEDEEKLAEELEDLEEEVMEGKDDSREATDYDRRAHIFDESSRVFQALKDNNDDHSHHE